MWSAPCSELSRSVLVFLRVGRRLADTHTHNTNTHTHTHTHTPHDAFSQINTHIKYTLRQKHTTKQHRLGCTQHRHTHPRNGVFSHSQVFLFFSTTFTQN